MAMLTLRISDDLNDRLTMMAEKTGRTKTWFVKKLIREGLADLEDQMLAEIAFAEYHAAGGRNQPMIEWSEYLKSTEVDDLPDIESPATTK
jgi:RHH-type rel operon transcriptional repressor/antitoxin RelB